MKLIHFSSLENNLNCSKNNNIILSWNLNNIYFKDFKKKEIFYVSKIWQRNKFKVKNKVLSLRINFLSQLHRELNLVHKINYSKKEWEILLEPWLNIYLSNIYFRWIVVKELIKVHKKFHYLEIKIKKEIPVFDTLQFIEFESNNDVFNHLIFQNILQFQKQTKQKKKLKKKTFNLDNRFIYKIYTKIKNNIVFVLYEKVILKIFDIKVLIDIRTKKFNFLKLCIKLNILPFKGISIFNRNKLIKISNKNNFEKKKRLNLNINPKKNNEFDKYIFNQIKNDIPRVFIENFNDIKNLHKNQLNKTKIVVTDTSHKFNPIFKSWLATKKHSNKNFKIITADHGGIYGGKAIYNYNQAISSIDFKYQKNTLKNQVSLPCLFLDRNNISFEDKILIISKDIPKYPKNILTGPICEEINYEFYHIKKFNETINNVLKKKIFIRPYLAQPGWRPDKKYKKIIGEKKIIYSSKEYVKLRNSAIIKIVTYPQTAFLECVINGPTFLLFNPKHYYESKQNEKFMNILFKNKIAFKNGKNLAIHLNQIEKNIQEWWQQKKIQKSIDLFIKNTNIYDENPTTHWAKNIKKFL